jgi:glycerophosphoryl diester phosphodiesterase
MIQAREMNVDPEIMRLLEDFEAAYERAFKFAIELKKHKNFEDIGELLRLELFGDKEAIDDLYKEIKNRKRV